MANLPNLPDWVAQGVSIGDDGNSVNPEPNDDGPLLEAFKKYVEKNKADYKDALAEHRRKIRQQAIADNPVYAPLTNSGTVDANGNLVIDLGGPQKGLNWVVRMLSYSDGGSYWNTMATAKTTMCIGIKTGNTVTPNMVRWPFPSSPNAATFSSGQYIVNPADHLLLSITNGSTGQTIQCTAMIQEYNQYATTHGMQNI